MAILGFRHKGLRGLFEDDDASGIQTQLAKKLKRMLAALDKATAIDDLETLPGWRLHLLKGGLKGFWSLTVSGNWRLVFRFRDGHAIDVDLIDYH